MHSFPHRFISSYSSRVISFTASGSKASNSALAACLLFRIHQAAGPYPFHQAGLNCTHSPAIVTTACCAWPLSSLAPPSAFIMGADIIPVTGTAWLVFYIIRSTPAQVCSL